MTRYNKTTGKPMLKVEICSGSACHNRGCYNVFQELIQLAEHDGVSDNISIETGLCMQQCDKPGVMVLVGDKYYGVDPLKVQKFYAKEIKPRI
jgi:NADH:ubiquinone oxidoreductase subunit E